MEITAESEREMNCPCIRSNTVCCDFSFMKRDLAVLEMHEFVKYSLQVQPETLELLQWNAVHKCLYLRLKNYQMAKHLVMMHNNRHVYPPGRQRTRVALTLMATQSVVMVLDLSELVPDEQVRDALEQYGVVLTIGHSLWGEGLEYSGIPSGHRIVRMIIRKPIPHKLRIGGEKSYVVYPEQSNETRGLRAQLSTAAMRSWNRLGQIVRRMIP